MQISESLSAWVAAQLGVSTPHVSPLRAEASQRRFYRVHAPDTSYVLMDSPPDLERNDAFVALAQVFKDAAIPVPEILYADLQHGWLLMTDLGPTELAQHYGTETQGQALERAVTTLVGLSAVRDAQWIPAYDAQRLHMELGIFGEWFAQGLLGVALTAPAQSDTLIEAMLAQPRGCVHRDYHSRNLLYNDRRLGIVDFQDALHGPILYDLASLLHDCYHRFDEPLIDHYLAMYLELHNRAYPQLAIDPDRARGWLDFTAIQRQLKAIGIFARLQLRDAKSTHIVYIAPLLERLVTLCGHYPELAALHSQLSDLNSRFKDR